MKQPYLTVKNLSYTYPGIEGEVEAIKDLSFQVYRGEFVAIVGPSGCGKSTLLSMIARLLTPSGGSIFFQNPDGSFYHPRIGYMLQHDYLLEWRSIYRNVTLGPEISKTLTPETREHIDKLLKDYGLYEFRDKKPGELSGGMRQRAALIRTLAINPELLLLDEPFSALDYQTRLSVSDDICKIIRSTKKTAILITHDLSEAISMADRILVLSKRPATLRAELPIHLTLTDTSTLAARKAPEFASYFNELWEELHDENQAIDNETKEKS